MEDIARVAKTVLVMNGGSVAMYAPTPEVFSRADELTAIGLAIPSVTRVFMELRNQGINVGDNVYTVEQDVYKRQATFCGRPEFLCRRMC